MIYHRLLVIMLLQSTFVLDHRQGIVIPKSHLVSKMCLLNAEGGSKLREISKSENSILTEKDGS